MWIGRAIGNGRRRRRSAASAIRARWSLAGQVGARPPEMMATPVPCMSIIHGTGALVTMSGTNKPCVDCQCRTPLRPDPENIQRARLLDFEPPLDKGIRDAVHVLVAAGVETFESCEGCPGHSFPEPTVRFEGNHAEGLRAASVALANGLPIFRVRRAWGIIEGELHGPWREMTFLSPRPGIKREV